MSTKTATKRKTKSIFLQAIVMYWREDSACLYTGFQGLPAWSKPYMKQIEPGVYQTIELQTEEWTLHVIPCLSYSQARSSYIMDPQTNYREDFELSETNEPYIYASQLAQEDQRRAGLQKDRAVIMRVIDLLDERLNDGTPLSVEDLSDAAQALHSCTESLAMIGAQEQGKPVHLHW